MPKRGKTEGAMRQLTRGVKLAPETKGKWGGKVRLTAYVDPAIHDELRDMAHFGRTSITRIVETMISEAVPEWKRAKRRG